MGCLVVGVYGVPWSRGVWGGGLALECRFAHGESELRKPKDPKDDPTRIVAEWISLCVCPSSERRSFAAPAG